MSESDAISLLYGGMDKLGPGSDEDTRRVLGMLPPGPFPLVVDAGCGTGRQTLVLAEGLQTPIHAVDTFEPFLKDLERRAAEKGLDHLIQAHCMDMVDIPKAFRGIDLLWSEGSAYSIGFPNALKTWREAIKPKGFAAVSELCWLRDNVPTEVRGFFRREYPDMRSLDQNRAVVGEAGYSLLDIHLVPPQTWVDGYYDVLGPRAENLLDHPDEMVRAFAAQTLEEIRIFGRSDGSYGYVFFLLQRAG